MTTRPTHPAAKSAKAPGSGTVDTEFCAVTGICAGPGPYAACPLKAGL